MSPPSSLRRSAGSEQSPEESTNMRPSPGPHPVHIPGRHATQQFCTAKRKKRNGRDLPDPIQQKYGHPLANVIHVYRLDSLGCALQLTAAASRACRRRAGGSSLRSSVAPRPIRRTSDRACPSQPRVPPCHGSTRHGTHRLCPRVSVSLFLCAAKCSASSAQWCMPNVPPATSLAPPAPCSARISKEPS